MTENDIKMLFTSYRANETQIRVYLECTDLAETEKYERISKQVMLVNHWLVVVSAKAQHILRRHLIDGVSWMALAEESRLLNRYPCDVRSLQRIQKRAIRSILEFTLTRFGDQLDSLSDFIGKDREE